MAEYLILKDAGDLEQLLRENAHRLLQQDVKELNYWLRYYADTSLNERLLEVAEGQGTNSEAVLALATGVLHNFDDIRLDPFASLERILTIVDTKKLWEDQSFMAGFAEQVALMLTEYAKRIEGSGNVDAVIGYLREFLRVLRATYDKHSQMWQRVMSTIPSTTFVPLARLVASNDGVAEFGELYQGVLAIVRSVENGGPWMEKVAEEEKAIRSKALEVEQQIDQEREQKRAEVEKAYDQMIKEKRKEVKKQNKELRNKSMLSFAFTIYFIFVSIMAKIYGWPEQSGFDKHPEAFFVFVLIELPWILIMMPKVIELAGELAGWLGAIFGFLLSVLIIYLVIYSAPVLSLIGAGVTVYYWRTYRNKLLEAAGLTSEEASARQLSLDRIEEYYRAMRRMRIGEIVVAAILVTKTSKTKQEE